MANPPGVEMMPVKIELPASTPRDPDALTEGIGCRDALIVRCILGALGEENHG